MGIHSIRVSSPTFTLHHEYPGQLTLHHLDLYRIDQPEEIEKLGLLELLGEKTGVVVIEWSEKAGGILPKESLRIRILWQDENIRRFEFQAFGLFYEELLKRFEALILNPRPSS